MDSTFNPSIEQLMLGNFVKYNTLSDLINRTMRKSNANTLNLFIDLYSLFKPLYSVDNLKYSNKSYLDITAFVLNMVCHYRYFFKYIGVRTRIFIIFGLNTPSTNQNMLPGYNSKFVEDVNIKRDVNNLISKNTEMLDLLCKYIPDVYFFNIGRSEVSSMVYNVMNKFRYHNLKSDESMIITKDILPLQLVPLFNMRILRPSKKNNMDESFIVDNETLMGKFFSFYRKSSNDCVISPNFISNFLALTRIPERSIRSMVDIRKAEKMISSCTSMGMIRNDKIYTQSVLNTALEAILPDYNTNLNLSAIDIRWKCINPEFQANYVLPIESPSSVDPILHNLEDNMSLRNIINRYFANNCIDLNRLV